MQARLGDASPEAPKYSFSGHETFPFRYPWLTKGVQAAAERPGLFTEDEAGVVLGVGKNMVKSIRHWCAVLRLIAPVSGDRTGRVRVTDLGRALFGPEGFYPYLEDPTTLWLLHWLLVSNRERA